jgi:ribosomal protein S18 acetylase RimI-like enzyme
LTEFIKECKNKGLIGVHLYAVESNDKAVNLYNKLGFEKYTIKDEQRPNDLHLIKYFKEH